MRSSKEGGADGEDPVLRLGQTSWETGFKWLPASCPRGHALWVMAGQVSAVPGRQMSWDEWGCGWGVGVLPRDERTEG